MNYTKGKMKEIKFKSVEISKSFVSTEYKFYFIEKWTIDKNAEVLFLCECEQKRLRNKISKIV